MFQALASMCAVPVLIVTGGLIFLATRGKDDEKNQQKSSDESEKRSN